MQDVLLTAVTGLALRLALIVLSLAGLYALVIVKQLVIAKVGETKFNTFYQKAETVVRSLEQVGLLPKWDGAYKKQVATSVVHRIADELGLSVSDQEISDIIESIVQIMNTETGKFAPPPMIVGTVGTAEG